MNLGSARYSQRQNMVMHRITIVLDARIIDMDTYVDVLDRTGSVTVADVVTDALPAIDWAQLGLELSFVSN